MRSDITYRFSIVNFSKPDSLYNYGMKPVLYSQIEAEKHFVGWSRVGSNIRYYRNESMFDEDEGYSFTLTFTINFPHDNDTVYLAHCYPYTYRYVFSNFLQKNFLVALLKPNYYSLACKPILELLLLTCNHRVHFHRIRVIL